MPDGVPNPTRSRCFARRYFNLIRRVKAGEAKLIHVSDAENPADFLTKWVSLDKLEASLEYVTNRRAAVEQTPVAFKEQAQRELEDAIRACKAEAG